MSDNSTLYGLPLYRQDGAPVDDHARDLIRNLGESLKPLFSRHGVEMTPEVVSRPEGRVLLLFQLDSGTQADYEAAVKSVQGLVVEATS